MNKKIKVGSAVIVFLFMLTNMCYAGLINYQRRNRRMGGGGGEDAPAAAPVRGRRIMDEESLAGWMKKLPVITWRDNRKLRRYDINRDNKLQTAEVKVYLRDVMEKIQAKGGYTIDSTILKEYDRNRDGVVSRYEARKITEHLR